MAVLLSASAVAVAEPPPGLATAARGGERDAPARIEAEATARERRASADPLFPGRGGVSASLATGVPFLAVGELAVGTSDAVTIGLVAGVADTMREYAVGGRARVAVFRAQPMSVVLSLPVLYYPPVAVRDDEPWLLANPSLSLHGRLPNDAGIYGGVGALAASCTHSLANHFGGNHTAPDGGSSGHQMINGVWNTVHAGGWWPVGDSTAVFVDGALMLEGLELSSSYADMVGPPALAQAGMTLIF
jgi:hypothetical protein